MIECYKYRWIYFKQTRQDSHLKKTLEPEKMNSLKLYISSRNLIKHTYIHTYIHTHTHTHTLTYTLLNTHRHTHIHTKPTLNTHIHTSYPKQTYTHTYTHLHAIYPPNKTVHGFHVIFRFGLQIQRPNCLKNGKKVSIIKI